MSARATGTLVFLIGLMAWATCAPAADGSSLQTHVAALVAPDTSAGSAGAQANADYVAAQLRRLTGQPVRRQTFLLALPVVESCTVAGHKPGSPDAAIPMAPLMPSGSQAAALPPDQASADLLYVGQGTLENLRGKDLTHRFVALDITSDPLAWQTAASLGARAIFFLGDGQTTSGDLLNKATDIPVGIPRFYCDDPEALRRIKSGEVSSLTVNVRVHWQEKRLENIFCYLPGSLGDKQYVILQARYDGSSQVMGRCPGATQAASAAALLDLAGPIAAAPERLPVLLVFTAGDEWNFRGTRAALDLLDLGFKDAPAAVMDLERSAAVAEARLQAAAKIRGGLRLLAGSPPDVPPNFAALVELVTRTALEDQLLRESSRIEEALQHARLTAPQDSSLLASLESQKDELLAATNSLNPAAMHTDAQRKRIQAAAAAVLPRWNTQVARLTELRECRATWPAVRAGIGGGDRTPMLFVSLALSSGSPRYGFFTRSFYSPLLDATGKMTGFAFRRYVPPNAGQPAAGFVSESMDNRFTLETFFPVHIGFSSDAALMRSLPAGAFATTEDAADFLDTPNDTIEHLNFDNLRAQSQSLTALLVGTPATPGALTDPRFRPPRTELPTYAADQQVTLFDRAVGETLPRLTAAQCLIGGQAQLGNLPMGPPLLATRRFDWYLTYADGTADFASCFRTENVHVQMQACDFDQAGLPLRTIAGNQAEVRGLAADFATDPNRPVRAMLFESQRLDCFGLFDPRYLDTLDKIDVYDAARVDKAQFSNVYAQHGMAAVFFPPDLRWQLLVAKGALANRMLLINADAQHPSGQGFTTTDLGKIGPLVWRNVLDLDALNAKRQHDLEKFGISNEIIKELQAASKIQIDAAQQAEKIRDYPAFFGDANAAWSLQSQVYENLIDTSNGIIKGVIFLLLGIIPFSYFLERLLVGSVNVYRQIAGFAMIFVAMTGALWFHPAFRISSAPLMILLAFLILILSSAVVYILWGKFEEEIARLRAGGGAGGVGGMAHSTSLRRGAVLGAAIRLGLSNMRRRGTRTALTLLTLILLTFTLLCFTSVRESVQITPRPVIFPTTLKMPPPGILLRQRAWATLPPATADLARELALPGSGPIAQRWWYSSDVPEQTWAIPVTGAAGGDTFYAAGLLGLEAAEANFQSAAIEEILPGFSRLADNSDMCWLPEEAKKSAPLAAGDKVNILGHSLTIAGFFNDASFRKLRELTGDPLSPIDPAGIPNSGGIGPQQLTAAPEGAYHFLNSAGIAVVPATLVRQFGGRLTSIMLRPSLGPEAGPGQATSMLQFAENLARRSAFPVYVSDGAKVRMINAASGAQPKDFSAVLVPMLIAAVIILNTMLGAVAERTREIHVYTSIGLAPSHVGMLFLAEAAALGTIGVVSGYIFGQGLATVLTWTHLLPGVELNYSSLSAIVTMGLVLALVMLSALWPARAATRVAAPSLQRDWKLPRPVGDILSVELPFTVNETAAKGVCAFIEEFFVNAAQSGGGSGGRFTADNIQAFARHDDAGPIIRGLQARIWLAPYDLGVIQMIRLSIHPTAQHNIFDVRLELTREAGNPGSWRRLNRPFLTEVRKQFLLWRNLSPDQIKHYLDRSETLFQRK